jgi:hypothetical protein
MICQDCLLSILDFNLHLEEKTMRKLKLICASITLTLLLSASAFADDGIITTAKDNTPPPPPPPALSTVQSAAADSGDTGGIMSTGAPVAETLAEVAAGVLQSVLALF